MQLYLGHILADHRHICCPIVCVASFIWFDISDELVRYTDQSQVTCFDWNQKQSSDFDPFKMYLIGDIVKSCCSVFLKREKCSFGSKCLQES